MIRTLLLLLYASSALATGHTSKVQCSSYCTESEVLALEPGTSLEYSYTGWAETNLSPHPAPDAAAALQLNASVLVRVISPCEISLEIRQARLSGESGGSELAALLTRGQVRASVQEGRVEAVCAPEAHSPAHRWALNVHKAVLSAFQLPLRSLDSPHVTTLHEVDVSGICRTEYQTKELENSTLVTKFKDLTHCSGRRSDIDLELPRTGFRTAATPLIKGSQSCIKTIKDGVLTYSQCKELHVFQPFSANNGSEGVTTTVHQTLVLQNVTSDEGEVQKLTVPFGRSSLLFEHGGDKEAEDSDIDQAHTLKETKRILSELAGETNAFSVKAESARLFSQLVVYMGKLDIRGLETFVTDVQLNDAERAFVMDALPTMDTPAAVHLMTSLYMEREKQIPKLKFWLQQNAAAWFASLAHSRKIDLSTIKQLQKLLVYVLMRHAPESDVPSIVLGVTGAARTYCELNGGMDSCSLKIYEIVSALEQVLQPEFHASEKTLITAMKGLGNIGVFVKGAETLKTIIQNDTASTELRLAAVDAFRRTPCSEVDLPAFLAIFSDSNQDTEIRIASYLVAVRCPSPSILRTIKRALYTETVNQVGSFVWTHLTNSQESTGKARQVLRVLLANEYLQNKFNTDARQFSRNFEGSHYFESLKLGTNFDANIIFSPKSYLPRSAMLNLTVDLFGESVNLIEVGGRAEGFESIVEQQFAKRGVFENEAIENFLKNARKDPQYEQINNLTSQMKKITTPKASAFVRFNGLEVGHYELENLLQNAYRFKVHPKDLLRSLLSRKELDLAKSMELISARRTVPTVIGIPLQLALNSTASVKIGLSGNFEKTKNGFEASALFAPSASVAVTGTISVGQDDFEQGVRFEATLFTQTSLDARINIASNGKFVLQTNLPEQKQTIVDLKMRRIKFNGAQEESLPVMVEQMENSTFCSGDWVDGLLGLRVCYNMQYPDATQEAPGPKFPLSADSEISVTIEKTDPTFKSYELSASWVHEPGVKYDYGIFFDRVGSEKANKRRAIGLIFDKEAGVASINLDLPEKQAALSILWDGKDFSAAELSVSYDRVTYAEILAKIDHQKRINHITKEKYGKIEPEIKFLVRNLPEFHLKGTINYSGKSKLTAELSLSGLTKQPLQFVAEYFSDMTNGAVNARVNVDSQYITWDVKANAKITPSSLGLRLNGIYNKTAETQHSLEIMTKYNWNQQGALRRIFLNLKSQLSEWPQYSGQLQTDIMTSKEYYESNTKLIVNNEEWNITQRLQASGPGDVWAKQTVDCIERDINFLLEHRHKYITDSFSTTTQLNVNKERHANFHLDYKYIQGDGIAFSAESKLNWPRLTFSNGEGPFLQSRVRQVFPGEFDAFLITKWSEFQEPLRLNAKYKDKSTLKTLSHSLDSTFTGAFWFTNNNTLGVKGTFEAHNNIANLNGSVFLKEEEKLAVAVKYDVDQIGEKSVAAKVELQTQPDVRKSYEFAGKYFKSPAETAASVDLKFSRHIAFSFRTSNDNDRASLFWDKSNDPSKNLTIVVEYPKANELAINLLIPGQNISMSGHAHYISPTSKGEDSNHLSGYAIGGQVSWTPERNIRLSTRCMGNFNVGLKVSADLQTKNIPVIGDQLRVLEADYVIPSERDGGKVTVKHIWANALKKKETFETHISIEKNDQEMQLDFYVQSTLWDPKSLKGRIKNNFKNWNNFNGNITGSCGQEAISFAWDWNIRNGAKMALDSKWSRIKSTNVEVKYNVQNKVKPGIVRNWVTFAHDEDVWHGAVNYKKEKTVNGYDLDLELLATTPLEDFEEHIASLAVTWNGWNADCQGNINTPLVGDYKIILSNRKAVSSDMMTTNAQIFAPEMVAELTLKTLSLTMNKTSVNIELVMPEIFSVKSGAEFKLETHGGTGKINFSNNDKLLHDFEIVFSNEDMGDAIKFELNFFGYSYLVMPTRWKLVAQHAGARDNHTSHLEVNGFHLDHKFERLNDEEWALMLTGQSDGKELLSLAMDHHGLQSCSHILRVMGTEVLNLVSKFEQNYVNLNLINNAIQVHTRIVDEDEFKTTTRIITHHKLYASIVTSTFLRYKDDNALESAIISLNVDANGNNARVQVNIDAWNRVMAQMQVKYSALKAALDIDVLSPNNSLQLTFSNNEQEQLVFNTFVFFSPPNAEINLKLHYKDYNLQVAGTGQMDERMHVLALVSVNDNMHSDLFPMTIEGELQLPKEEEFIATGGKIAIKTQNQGEVHLTLNTKIAHGIFNLNGTVMRTADSLADSYRATMHYDNREKLYVIVSCSHNVEKYELELILAETLFEARFESPLENFEYVSLKAGTAEITNHEKRILEFIRNDYRLDAELIYKREHGKIEMMGIAKSNNGFEVDAAVVKIVTQVSTDVAFSIKLNDFSKIETGAYLQYEVGNLNITANITRNDRTSHIRSVIYNTKQMKSFSIVSNFMRKIYELEIYSSSKSGHAYEQGFKMNAEGFVSEFRYQKSDNVSVAYLRYQDQILQCELKGNSRSGQLSIYHSNKKTISEMRSQYNFENKIEVNVWGFVNKLSTEPAENDFSHTPGPAPIDINALFDPDVGHILLSYHHNEIKYYVEGKILKTNDQTDISLKLESPHFTPCAFNVNYNGGDVLKKIAINIQYGTDFYQMNSELSVDNVFTFNLQIDARSSTPGYETIAIRCTSKKDEELSANLKIEFPNESYVATIGSDTEKTYSFVLKTRDNTYALNFHRKDLDLNYVEYLRDGKQIFNATLQLVNETLLTTVMTPLESFKNLTLSVGYGSSLPRKHLIIHKNNDIVFEGNMYSIDHEEFNSGTGIMATIYRGNQKLVYDAQFSIENPIVIVLKQHDTGNGTRDILHFNFNVTDENTASGSAEIHLPLSPNTKLQAKGHMQIENRNAEFKMSYKFDEEEENNFAIHYSTYKDNYNIYNIVANMRTPYEEYDNMTLRITSSWTETVVKFTSQFPNYENIALVAVHRLEGTQKELWVQYQNHQKSIFYVKAIFLNEENAKRIELKTRTPFLNGQSLVSNNGSVMEFMLEHENIVLCQIISKYENITKGKKYEFSFRKPERTFLLQSSFENDLNTVFHLNATLDEIPQVQIKFNLDAFGVIKSFATFSNDIHYTIIGQANWLTKTMHLEISDQDQAFDAELDIKFKSQGYFKIASTKIQNIEIAWEYSDQINSINFTREGILETHFVASNSHVSFEFNKSNHIYSFVFGQIKSNSWPNLHLVMVWDSELVVDFLHDFLTDNHLLIVKTRLTSPYLGNHKNMKFSVTMKTRDTIEIDAEFKWRPKDLTAFKASLQMNPLTSIANISFVSPFTSKFVFTAKYDFSSTEKTFEIVYTLVTIVSLRGRIIPTGTDQSIFVELLTPISGYTSVEFSGFQKNIGNLLTAQLQFIREGERRSIEVFSNDRNLQVIANLPESRWTLNTNYHSSKEKHSIDGTVQWGGAEDVISFQAQYKPHTRLLINIDGPSMKYTVDYTMAWTQEKKSLELKAIKNFDEIELSGSVSTKANVQVIFAMLNSTFTPFLKATALANVEAGDLGGALQIDEDIYKLAAHRVRGDSYDISLIESDLEKYKIEVAFEGNFEQTLNFYVTCKTPEYKFNAQGSVALNDSKTKVSFTVSWGEKGETVTIAFDQDTSTEIELKLNTQRIPDSYLYLSYGHESVTAIFRNQSDIYKGHTFFKFADIYSVNASLELNSIAYEVRSYYDPHQIQAYGLYGWSKERKIEFNLVLKPGDVSMTFKTPYAQFTNIQVNGKYSEMMSYNSYQLSSKADAKWNEYLISLSGILRSSQNNYGLTGRLSWDNKHDIDLSFGVSDNKRMNFDLKTPFRGLPHFSAQLEALRYRQTVSGMQGTIHTPFNTLPVLNFMFNRPDDEIDLLFSFDTSTYKNITIHTKLKNKNSNYLKMIIKTPFVSSVKHFLVEARSNKIKNGLETKIIVQLDEKSYEMSTNHTSLNGKLDSTVSLNGPSHQFDVRFGGKFLMQSIKEMAVEAYMNDALIGLSYDVKKDLIFNAKIHLTSLIKLPKTELSLIFVRGNHFEGNVVYLFGDLNGNALVKNKFKEHSLETIMYLNLPQILKHPLQVELNADYIKPRLQFNGFASYVAEHRLELIMVQTSFRTTLNAQLQSAFFKGTNKVGLTLSSGELSVSMNDEIKITCSKKTNHLILTLSQMSKRQDHTITYNWDFNKLPTIEIALESQILAAGKATFSATYLGPLKGVNIKLVSGSETLRLDYDVKNSEDLKVVKLTVGNTNGELLNFAAYLDNIPSGHEIGAQLNIFDIDYKAQLKYTLPIATSEPNVKANLFLNLPYLFPFKIFNIDLVSHCEDQKFTVASNVSLDTENVEISGVLTGSELLVHISSTFDNLKTLVFETHYEDEGEQKKINSTLKLNNEESLNVNASLTKQQNGAFLKVDLLSRIQLFEKMNLKLMMPSENWQSITANFELSGSTDFDVDLIMSFRPGYTNFELNMTGLYVNMYLTSNQGYFGYRTPSDEYNMKVYSKYSEHQLESEVTVNSSNMQLFKAGLFGMFQNHSEFYILMSTNCVYENMPDAVLYVGAKKSEIKFGTEFDFKKGSKDSYSVIINHFIASATDFDVGIIAESPKEEIFTAKLTHISNADFYIALAQVNKDVVKITKIKQNLDTLVTATVKCGDFSTEVSGKYLDEIDSKALDLKLTWYKDLYQVGGSYNYSETEYIHVKANLNSPQTGSNSFIFEFDRPTNLLIIVDREQSPVLIVELNDEKVRSKYALLNMTDTKFMLGEYYNNQSYELTTSLLFNTKTYQASYTTDSFLESPTSFRTNVTLALPTRTVGFTIDKYVSEIRNSSQMYASWENLDKKVGYSYAITNNNVEASVEIPNRAIDLKLHHKVVEIPDEMTQLEYGVQFNWNSKIRLNPVTFITTIKIDHEQKMAYHYSVFAHPSFNSSYVVDGQLSKPNSHDNFFTIKMGPVYEGKMTPALTTKLNMTRKSASSEYHLLVEHPASNLNQQWDVQLNYDSGLTGFITLLNGATQGYSSINFILDNQQNKVSFGFVHNELTTEVLGQLIVDRPSKKYGVYTSCSFDMLMPPITAIAYFERPEMSHWLFNAEINLAPERSYTVETKFTPHHISALVASHEYEEVRPGLQAALTLNTTSTISFVGKYKPAVYRNFTSDLQEPMQKGEVAVRHIIAAFGDILREQLFIIRLVKSDDVSSAYNKIVKHTAQEWNSVRQDIASFKQLVRQFYERDTFYMKTVSDYILRVFTQGYPHVSSGMHQVYETLRNFVTKTMPSFFVSIYNSTIEPLVSAFQKFSPTFTKFVRKIMTTGSEISNGISTAVRTSMSHIQEGATRISKHSSENFQSFSNWANETKQWIMTDYIEPGREGLVQLASALENFFEDLNAFAVALPAHIKEYFMELEEVKGAINFYTIYSPLITEFRVTHCIAKIQNMLNEWYEYIIEDLQANIGEYAQIIPKVINAIKNAYEEILAMPSMVYLRMVYQAAQEKIHFLWKFWEMEQLLQELLIRASDEMIMIVQKISESTEDYREKILVNEEEWSLKYNPQKGEISGSVALPISWKRFDQMPTLAEDVSEKFHNFRYSMLDKVYELATVGEFDWKDTFWRTVMPSFHSNALITVNGHVITFDGNHYKIKNVLCGSYLFAADYVDHSFALVATFGNEPNKVAGQLTSMTLYTKNKNKISIDMSLTSNRADVEGQSRIYLNDSKVELPLMVDDFEVSRLGPKVVVLNKDGVGLYCNIVNGLCSTDLSGWYHGKVAGIAGSLDKEQRNDFARPDGKVLDSVSAFLEQWKVNSPGECETPLKVKTKPKDFAQSVCVQLFTKSDSPMQPCFLRLDPEPFRVMCEQEILDGGNTDKRPDCVAAEAYMEQCKLAGMELSLPLYCSRCRLASGRSIQAGDVVVFDNAPKARTPAPPQIADFVFLIENSRGRNCLRGQHLQDLPAKIDTVLRATQAINSTKFALLSYGAGKPFTVHTMEGHIWNGRRGIQNALAKLRLPTAEAEANNHDLYQALLAASSKLRFRPGASKNVILAPCTSCERSEDTATVFSEASSLLLEADIRLHVLQSNDMMFKRTISTQKTKQGKINPVMGVDSLGAYTGRRIKGTSIPLPSKAIMRQLSIPKDLCTPLALETNGTLFSASRLTGRGAGDDKRKWLDVWSRRVASAAKPTGCQTCDCVPLPDGSSKLMCHPCISPSIEIFLDEWEQALEEAMQEEFEEDIDSIEVPDLEAEAGMSEIELEKEAINRVRDSLFPGSPFAFESA